MSVENPLISLIVPAYNAERYIAETIRSVLDQTYEKWELIVVNDGSTDATSQIVSSFGDQRIHLIEQANGGVGSARNAGLDKAKGDYITFLDADDVLPPESLKSRVDYLQTHPEVGLVDGQIVVKDEHLSKTLRIYQPYYTGRLLPRLLALDSRVFFNVCYMFRRELLNDIRFKAGMTHVEDLLFYMELSDAHSVNYGFVDEAVYWYRSGHASAMANLEGLENGYVQLLRQIGKMANATSAQKAYIHLRVARIMFLSWLRRRKPLRAFRSLFVMFNPIGGY